MESLIKFFCEYHKQDEFLKFQNDLADELYDSLSKKYSNGEVAMVKEMCNILNSKKYKNLNLYSKMLHGFQTSGVQFKNQNITTKKELADMVIISIATLNNKILFQKIAFIQNKKDDKKGNTWLIDQDQLYLLQNFPTFDWIKGSKKNGTKELKGRKNICLPNYSKTLGNYGLFQSPGEMILINALNVFKLQNNKRISFDDIKRFSYNKQCDNSFFSCCGFEFFIHEFRYWLKYHPECCFPFFNFPFLNNVEISYNIYDFVRNWSLFNIGEIVTINGVHLNKELSKLSGAFIKSVVTDFGNVELDIEGYENIEEYMTENGTAVFVNHFNYRQE